jgi:uracil-DNA glycosylase family 4
VPENTVLPIDENTRRYYLDVMGIQCWESKNSTEELVDGAGLAEASDGDVVSFDALDDAVQQCEQCSLHGNRKQAITGRGSLSAELMFILLGPDESDDKAAMICSGEADILLTKMLAAINVSVNDVYVTSLLKCAVPATHTVSTTELHHCKHHLKQQIRLIKPKLLVVLGEITARCMLQESLSLDDLRSVANVDVGQKQFEGVPLVISYSPQELMQQPDSKRKAWSDLQQIQKIIQA